MVLPRKYGFERALVNASLVCDYGLVGKSLFCESLYSFSGVFSVFYFSVTPHSLAASRTIFHFNGLLFPPFSGHSSTETEGQTIIFWGLDQSRSVPLFVGSWWCNVLLMVVVLISIGIRPFSYSLSWVINCCIIKHDSRRTIAFKLWISHIWPLHTDKH